MANEVRTFTLNDDPGQVIEDLNAAFDGTTQTGLKAESANNALNVTTNINGKAITDIFEPDGLTVKEATHAASADSCTGNSATTTNASKLNNRQIKLIASNFSDVNNNATNSIYLRVAPSGHPLYLIHAYCTENGVPVYIGGDSVSGSISVYIVTMGNPNESADFLHIKNNNTGSTKRINFVVYSLEA